MGLISGAPRKGFQLHLVGLLMLTVGCVEPEVRQLRYGPAELDHSHMDVTELTGQVLFDGEALAIPTDVAIVGNHLVVIDIAADSSIHVFTLASGELVRTFGRRGEGPGEFKRAWSLDPVPGSHSECWVYDVALGRLTYVDLRDEFFDGDGLGDRIINLTSEARSLGPVRTADANKSLSLGMYTKGRLGVYDAEGRQEATVASLPPGASDVPPNVRQHAYQATLIPHPGRRLFAAATRHASLIEIYRSDGSLVAHREGPLHVEPTYQVRYDGERAAMATGAELRFGYVDGSASNGYLFALFSGRTREGSSRGTQIMGRFVHVFDWNGNFKKAIQLDTDVIAIAVDESSNWLYGLRHNPHPAIVRYSLDDALLGDTPSAARRAD